MGRCQGRIFILGTLSYFELGTPREDLRRLISYKSALHVLATFTEQVVPIHKYITVLYSEFPPYQEPEPRQPPSISPIGGPRRHMGPKFRSLNPPKLKYLTLEISEVFVNPYPALSCNL